MKHRIIILEYIKQEIINLALRHIVQQPVRFQYAINIKMQKQFDLDNFDEPFENLWYESQQQVPMHYKDDFQGQTPQVLQTQTSYSDPTKTVSKSKTQHSLHKDSNPNLLKNLVATLRSWVAFTEDTHGKYQAALWKYFKQTSKINKFMVWALYGNLAQDPAAYSKIKIEVPVLTDISIQQYKKIQQAIKKETLAQLKKSDIEYVLKYRRVQNREQFNAFFYDFVDKLQNGIGFKKKSK